jgi:hypothetical protein
LPSSVFILNAGAICPSTLALAAGTAAKALVAGTPEIIESATTEVANNFFTDFMNRSLIELFKTDNEHHSALSEIKQPERSRQKTKQFAPCFFDFVSFDTN